MPRGMGDRNMSSRTTLILIGALIGAGCEDTVTEIVEIQAPPPPPPVSTPLTIDVQASQLDGNFLLGGAAFPGSVYQSADIYLRDQATLTLVELGRSNDQSYQAMVVNGTYDSVYQHFTGGDVPVNKDNVVNVDLPVNAPSTMDIDVPSATVRTVFLLDGSPFPASVYNHASFTCSRSIRKS